MSLINLRNYFEGNFQAPPTTGRESCDQTIERTNPADLNEKIWEYHICLAHVEKVIDSAQKGFGFWHKTNLNDRHKILNRYLAKLEEKKEDLAKTLSLENGQPFTQNKAEIEILLKQTPELLAQYEKELQPTLKRHACAKGPALLIGSFCRPLFFTHRFIIANLFCGNSLILKPSEKVALTVEKMVQCLHESDFPSGVVNLIHGQGDGEVPRRLIRDRRIRVIFFTGSHEVGCHLHELCSPDLERSLSFALTRKNIAILSQGFNQERGLRDLQIGAYQLSGQDCYSTSLAFIHQRDKDSFIERFHQETKKLVIDQPFKDDPESFMGPLIDQQAMDNYILYMGMAKREGHEEIMRGKQLERPKKGHYVTPSIHFAPAFKEKSHFLQSVLLGPNMTFIAYDDFEQAIQMANAFEFPSYISLYDADSVNLAKAKEALDTQALFLNRPTTSAIEELWTSEQIFPQCLRMMELNGN